MERLNKIREEINKIDKKILEDLEARVVLTTEVAKIKAETLAAVYVPEREKEIIKELQDKASKSIKNIVAPVFGTIIRLSRRSQFEAVYKKLKSTEFGETLDTVASKVSDIDAGKHPCLEVTFREFDEVNNFFNIINDYGFYPLEFSLKSKSGLICRGIIAPIEQKETAEKTEEMFIKALYQLCNEFEHVKLVGWI